MQNVKTTRNRATRTAADPRWREVEALDEQLHARLDAVEARMIRLGVMRRPRADRRMRLTAMQTRALRTLLTEIRAEQVETQTSVRPPRRPEPRRRGR